MSEEDNTTQAASANEGATPPVMRILGQFIRDLSFENALVQKGIDGQINPDVSVEVALDARKRPTDNQFEVVTKYKVGSKNKEGGETLFLLEVEYGGIFFIENIPEDQMHPFLMIECPRMLFPYARRLIADITREGGFPPVNLDNIDFVALYRAELARQAQAQAESGAQPN